MEEKPEIKLSVRNLVEFVLRSGDLDNRRTKAADREAMQKGSRLHRKIQRSMGLSYHSEVPLVYEYDWGDFLLRLEGRADGIITEDTGVMIDEIKGVYMDFSYLEKPVEVHLAQAKCYACIYALQHHLDTISVQMTYCHMETENIRRFQESYETTELEKWFEDLLDSYYPWVKFQYEWKQKRKASIEQLDFPFSYRKGQKRLVSGVYQTIIRGRQLFIQAPTGVGKTMSVIYPAIRSVGMEKGDKIFYLTAKTVTRAVAEEAFAILKDKGLAYKTITLTSKEKMCFCEETDCNPAACPYAKGHFDRVNDAVYEMLVSRDTYDRETLLAQAEKWQVCPYEMSLDTASWVDAIICDYNYVFDPNVHLRRFFGENVKGEYLFLIDEAHNLVERGRKMYSAVLCKEDFLDMKRTVKGCSKKLERYLGQCNKILLEYKRSCDTYEILPNTGSFPIALMNLLGEMEVFLEGEHEPQLQKKVLEFSFAVRHFLNICDLVDENYVIYTEHGSEGRFYMHLFCVNPSANLQNCLDKGNSAVFFSATMLPVTYYQKLFSTRENDYTLYIESPFAKENLGLFIGYDVSSRYSRRGSQEYLRIAGYLQQMVQGKPGNYMAFFPSYQMMRDVYESFSNLSGAEQISCILQEPSMSEQEKEEFLSAFAEGTGQTLLGFCVMGGVFSEGIDLTGSSLIGAAVVGTGIPQIGREREILKDYYDRKGENGFDYAYRIPGMNKVLQAAGRVIRTQEDKGVVLLLDDRFLKQEYQEMFPQEWKEYETCILKNIPEKSEAFWMRSSRLDAEKPDLI
ncbi:MAG: ATP-dependent DNA helicase [Lachnospiraceae bacterium]